MLLNKKNKILFLTKKSYFKTLEKIDIILSPEFYWVREFEIPVKNKKEALVFLPNLFSDVLPSDDFSYFVIKKSKHHFLCFAYKNSEILEFIKNANIQNTQVNNIYFAQVELVKTKAFCANGEQFIYTDDEILVKTPFLIEDNTLDISSLLQEHTLSNHKIKLQFYSSLIDIKYIYSIAAVSLVLIFLNMFQYFIVNKNISILEEKEESIKKQYNLPVTSFETNAILKKMKRSFKISDDLRQAVGDIFDYQKVDTKAVLKRVEYDGKVFHLDIEKTSDIKAKDYFSKHFKSIKQSKKADLISLELTYE
ncbi:hypothetical protein [Arcobacter sp.]|uniref:hypothetical protein n=1 Tax=Arcobacter sp. TaxID=1872629 RepID=UPI003D0E0AE8